MSRYTREHRERTRQRIIETAAALFRRHGYDGVGIERIMVESGLTRGGFYHHFASKADLLAAVLDGPADFARRIAECGSDDPDEVRAAALKVVDGYLAPANRDRVGDGCSLASLSVDVARGDAAVREGYRAQFEKLLAQFQRALDAPERHDARAIRAIALCVGGLVLSRALAPSRLADRVARVCRDAVAEVLQR